jgi:hypothetical protein
MLNNNFIPFLFTAAAGKEDLENMSVQRKKISNTILFLYIFIPNLYMF